MRADFYQLGEGGPEAALPLIARAALAAGERLLVVAEDDALRVRLSEALWTRLPDSFLAHGEAGGTHDARQPILLAARPIVPANGARLVAFADGLWRDAAGFGRAFLLFGEATLAGARAAWRRLGEDDAVERRFWKQEGGRWVEGP